MRFILALPLLLAVSGCNGPSIATQWTLRNFNVATADLAQTRFALGGPPWIAATPERGAIEVRYWRDGDDEATAKLMTLRLQKATHASDREALEKAGGTPSLAVIELTPASLAAARAAQQEAAHLKAEGAKTRGRIHLAGTLGCRRGDIPPGPIPIDIFVHADNETGWLPLDAGLDARASAKDEADLDESLPPCPQQAKAH
jgi:hypothetical protein